ncbi:putative quinol monooxygenase [Caulobacter sp. S45]|uniref:putative quinol monooxygenase n=1 Tax=Caulobacter sp. S45 TaxID=1641861 RepID=UPI0015758BCD|nr:putative quinol monooxygenase [Caulobacter sp. S45]
MIGVIAVLKAKEGREAEFERTFAEMTAKVKANEPGNQMYQLTRSRTEPRTYKVLEMYADQAAFDAHGSSDHYKEGGRALRDLVESRPEVELLDALI